jgi:LysM repeat protein
MKKCLLVTLAVLTLVLAGFSFPRDSLASCEPVRHVVKAGQNLTQIAALYGVSVAAIVQANNLFNPNIIYVGQVLLIPVPCTAPAPSGCTSTYIVQRGDYLKLIAAKFRTTVAVLVSLNNISNPNLSRPTASRACRLPQPKAKTHTRTHGCTGRETLVRRILEQPLLERRS